MSLRKIYYALTPRQRLWVRRLVYFPIDLWNNIFGSSRLAPPKGKIYTGSGDFLAQGETFLAHFKKYGKLKAHHRVLDIGSGIGRMAIPLSQFLNKKGSYEGFDVVKEGVEWCKKNISSQHPNFKFRLVNLENDLYNNSPQSAADFVFPYTNRSFDFIFLTSVFTHMLPREVENYVREIGRVLKPGGRCMATFFIINDQALDAMKQRPKGFQFPHNHGHYRLMDAKVKTANVAFEEVYILQLFATSGMKVVSKNFGFWTGRKEKECLDFQDVFVFEKLG